MCQSLALPSLPEYWHIGEIMMRLGRVWEPTVIGVNSKGAFMLYLPAGEKPPLKVGAADSIKGRGQKMSVRLIEGHCILRGDRRDQARLSKCASAELRELALI